MELKQLSRDHHSGSFKKDAAQKAVLGLQSLETCSPRLRHMEEIKATRVALVPVSLMHRSYDVRAFGV